MPETSEAPSRVAATDRRRASVAVNSTVTGPETLAPSTTPVTVTYVAVVSMTN